MRKAGKSIGNKLNPLEKVANLFDLFKMDAIQGRRPSNLEQRLSY
jgi:hypothetical protein